VIKLQKQHRKVVNIRKDATHKATTAIVNKNPGIVVIEDLKVKNMVKNHNLAQSLSDASFGEIRRQLTYKCKNRNIRLIEAPWNYPSSKKCWNCENRADLKLSDRTYLCTRCGYINDRDLNAALNLMEYGVYKFTKSIAV
jgi:putative transposase